MDELRRIVRELLEEYCTENRLDQAKDECEFDRFAGDREELRQDFITRIAEASSVEELRLVKEDIVALFKMLVDQQNQAEGGDSQAMVKSQRRIWVFRNRFRREKLRLARCID